MTRLYRMGLGRVVGRMILLLTTIGRKSGLPRTTPLQYEVVDGDYIVAAALGEKADWVRNLRADATVSVEVGSRKFSGTGEVINDTGRIADFLQLRLQRHPRMVRASLRADGVTFPVSRAALERYAGSLVMVLLHANRWM